MSDPRPGRVGLLGGTFDPPHNGHVKAAVEAEQRAGLDLVLWVVAREPWQKAGEQVSPPAARFSLVEACVEGLDRHVASRIEMNRPGPTYTVDTLREVRSRMPGTEMFLIVGADVAATIHTWHEPAEVRRLAELLVVARPEGDVSSTEVRRRLRRNEAVDDLVPAPVIREIARLGLYPPQ